MHCHRSLQSLRISGKRGRARLVSVSQSTLINKRRKALIGGSAGASNTHDAERCLRACVCPVVMQRFLLLE